jgi:hypothetical protein
MGLFLGGAVVGVDPAAFFAAGDVQSRVGCLLDLHNFAARQPGWLCRVGGAGSAADVELFGAYGAGLLGRCFGRGGAGWGCMGGGLDGFYWVGCRWWGFWRACQCVGQGASQQRQSERHQWQEQVLHRCFSA